MFPCVTYSPLCDLVQITLEQAVTDAGMYFLSLSFIFLDLYFSTIFFYKMLIPFYGKPNRLKENQQHSSDKRAQKRKKYLAVRFVEFHI